METIKSSNKVTKPSLVALLITVCISIGPTSTQAAIAAVNSSDGDRRLKINMTISVATISATSVGSILRLTLGPTLRIRVL